MKLLGSCGVELFDQKGFEKRKMVIFFHFLLKKIKKIRSINVKSRLLLKEILSPIPSLKEIGGVAI